MAHNIKNELLEVFSKAEQALESLTTISSARYFFILSSLDLVDENRIYPFKRIWSKFSNTHKYPQILKSPLQRAAGEIFLVYFGVFGIRTLE